MGSFLGWVGLLAVVGMVIWSWLKHFRGRDETHLLVERAVAPHMEGDGSFGFDVVGEGSYQDALDFIAGGKTKKGHEIERLATLIREPHNPHDKNAIAVIIDGRKVGYIARTEAKVMATMIDQRGYSQLTADAMIVGGWTDSKGEGYYGVKLDLHD